MSTDGSAEKTSSATDIDVILAEDVIHKDDSEPTRVDFEVSFYMLILTIVLAYPQDSLVYTGLKGLLVLAAVLTVARRTVVLTRYRKDMTRFMTVSKELLVEMSLLGVVYALSRVSELIHGILPLLDVLLIFAGASILLTLFQTSFFGLFARDEGRLYQIILSTQWANHSPIRYWQRYHRNRAIRKAQKLDIESDKLPKKVRTLQNRESHRAVPFPNETAQFLVGLLRRIVLWTTGGIVGWLMFGELAISLTLVVSMTLIGGQINFLYRHYGLEGYLERPSRLNRRLLQNLSIFFAHYILIF